VLREWLLGPYGLLQVYARGSREVGTKAYSATDRMGVQY